jgi:hypothetical protein
MFEQPAPVVLDAISRPFHFDHPVLSFLRPKLNEVRKTGSVFSHVTDNPLKPKPQVGYWKAIERPLHQGLIQGLPSYEWGLDPPLLFIRLPDNLAIAT